MIALLTLLAAAAPPEGFDRDDIEGWERRARAAARGQGIGCWRLTGEARVEATLFLPPTPFSSAEPTRVVHAGPFEATWDDGTWTRFDASLTYDGVPVPSDLIVGPALGTFDRKLVQEVTAPADDTDTDTDTDAQVAIAISSDGVSVTSSGTAAASTLGRLVDGALTDMPATSYVTWDEGMASAVLVVEAALDEDHPNDPITTTVRFPGAASVPTAFDTSLQGRVTLGEGLGKARILALELRVRGQPADDVLLPTLERLTGAVGVLGITVGYEQTLVYRTAQRCPAE